MHSDAFSPQLWVLPHRHKHIQVPSLAACSQSSGWMSTPQWCRHKGAQCRQYSASSEHRSLQAAHSKGLRETNGAGTRRGAGTLQTWLHAAWQKWQQAGSPAAGTALTGSMLNSTCWPVPRLLARTRTHWQMATEIVHDHHWDALPHPCGRHCPPPAHAGGSRCPPRGAPAG